MDSIFESCRDYHTYPRNLQDDDQLPHRLALYQDELKSHDGRLFGDEKQAAVYVIDFVRGREPRSDCWRSLDELEGWLRMYDTQKREPKCRYTFIDAPHSRAALRISPRMLRFMFSYYQVMACFLEFIFPFGRQEYAEDSYFSGLKENVRLNDKRRAFEIRLCYNLRSAERSPSQKDFPWSIRQTAVFHSIDLETGEALWIIIKGNKLLKKRLEETSVSTGIPQVGTNSEVFSASLVQHFMLCDWSAENWRWYINDLDAELQALSRDAIALPIDQPARIESAAAASPPLANLRTNSKKIPAPVHHNYPGSDYIGGVQLQSPIHDTDILQSFSQQSTSVDIEKNNSTGANQCFPHLNVGSVLGRLSGTKFASSLLGSATAVDCGDALHSSGRGESRTDFKKCRTEGCPKSSGVPGWKPPGARQKEQPSINETFSVGDLQRIHYIEEKIQETILVLKLDMEVLLRLRQLYCSLRTNENFPAIIGTDCSTDLMRFEKRVLAIEDTHRLQLSRAETLLQLLHNRKELLHDIIQFQSMKANELSARRAQTSADNMESMTVSMHEIARKTNQETVSMRVITSVTLFFLPGTFVATIMSTDIISFVDKKSVFQLKGLRIYLAISVPMMLLTFMAWYVFYRMERRRDELVQHITQDHQDTNSV
ncbi:hypothetical protein BCR34DRAFT_547476 [Clohesyomyces aquaticus]|uniref:CorA-like transporter domain-containing protein n=1 Tax=Clohesyomyces aquaticus TaxID=1231657 RepID=A0A1Y1YND9_9PLEO|nr:hypothetical protein BCR34DRAFT_547476 [Clohesyomyces aquaticus]